MKTKTLRVKVDSHVKSAFAFSFDLRHSVFGNASIKCKQQSVVAIEPILETYSLLTVTSTLASNDAFTMTHTQTQGISVNATQTLHVNGP